MRKKSLTKQDDTNTIAIEDVITMNAAVAATREQDLRDVREHLSGCNVKQDLAFFEALAHALRTLELSDQDVADGLLVSRPTVNRWKNNKNLPHPALRKPVLGWLMEQTNKRLRLRERSAAD
jgi:DNA-binding transcriptional regulator YiaG